MSEVVDYELQQWFLGQHRTLHIPDCDTVLQNALDSTKVEMLFVEYRTANRMRTLVTHFPIMEI